MDNKRPSESAQPRVSAFADAEALKKATAAKIGKLKSPAETSAGIVLQRPLSKWFFMTPDDDEMLFSGGTWLDPETKELYFVTPNMWENKHLVGAIRPTLFVPYVTASAEGEPVHGIWPISTLPNSYNDSLHTRILPQSRVTWVRVWTLITIKEYTYEPAEDDYGKPTWLAKTIFEQLEIVFPPKRQIQDDDHHIIGVLAGRKQQSKTAS
jgi:hypothetical protein